MATIGISVRCSTCGSDVAQGTINTAGEYDGVFATLRRAVDEHAAAKCAAAALRAIDWPPSPAEEAGPRIGLDQGRPQ